MADRIQFRRDTAANWTAYNPVLLEGEVGIELDTDQWKLGDGVHTWSQLAYRGGECVQQRGQSTTVAMSQKAVTDELNLIGVFDISAYNLTDGQPTKYADLTAALGTHGDNIPNVPTQYRVPGMTIRYIQSSDSKYVQYRYIGTSLTNNDFVNVANWQGVDAEPTAGSKNLAESGGIEKQLTKLKESVGYYETEIININSTYDRSNNWWLPSLTENIIAGNRYIIEYTDLNVVPSQFKTAINNGGTGKQNLRPYLSVGSGVSEFVATVDATNLRAFNSTAYSGTIKIYKIQSSSHEIDETREEIAAEEKQIVKIKDLLEVDESESVNINSTYDRSNDWWLPSLTENIIAGNRYIIEYTDLNVVPSIFATATSNGSTAVQSLIPYLSVGSGRSEFIATNDATNLRAFNSTAYSGTIKIYKEIYKSDIVEGAKKVDDLEFLNKIDDFAIKYNFTDNHKYEAFTYTKINTSAVLQPVNVDISIVRKYSVVPNQYVKLYNINNYLNSSKIYFVVDEEGNVIESSSNYNAGTAPSETELFIPEGAKYIYVSGFLKYLYSKNQPYKGLKILSLGDSFTYLNNYGKYLADETGCTQRGRGQNGGHIGTFVADAYDTGTGRVSEPFDWNLVNDYDIITIMGGTNDFGQNCPIGEKTDSIDAGTLWGHIKKVLTKIFTLKPHAIVFYCTQPYRCPNPDFHGGKGGYEPNGAGLTLEDTMNACIKIFSYYGVPCFDFYHTCGWNEFNNKVTNPENIPISGSWGYSPFKDNILTTDGLHPKAGENNGGEQLGRALGNFINNSYVKIAKKNIRNCGIVKDENDEVIGNTKLTFSNSIFSALTTSTDENGIFYKALPIGTFNISVDGYTNVSPSSITIEKENDWNELNLVVSNEE